MFRKFLFFSLLLFQIPAFSQDADTLAEKTEPAAVNTSGASLFDSAAAIRFQAVDKYVLSMKKRNKPIAVLGKEITAPFNTDEEKVRAIFIWMTNNISYDCVAYHAKNAPSGNFTFKSQEELIRKLDEYYTKKAMLVMRNKKAVCDGYAILFRELCKANNINCQFVDGKASENRDKIKKLRNRKNFSCNHTWNKVLINGTWYFVDVTWASGFCDKDVKKFTKKFNSYYFLTPTDKLYATHAENVKFTERHNNPVYE